MAQMVNIKCKCGCGRKKLVRKADRDRGWGLFYSKSCKAMEQEKRTGQYSALRRQQENNDWLHPAGYGHIFASGDEGHGQE